MKEYSPINLYDKSKVLKTAVENNNLINVIIELLTECNWRCKHCYLPEHNNKGMTFEQIKDILMQLRALGVFEITFTGGEVFCRKDIMDIIKLARGMGFMVAILSNISLLNEEIIVKLSEMFVERISCTIFSLNPEIHDNITGCKGSLEKTLENTKLIQKYNISLEIKTVLMKDNVFEYKAIEEYCINNGFDFLIGAILDPSLDFKKSNVDLMLTEKELEEVIPDVDRVASNEFNTPNLDDFMCNGIHFSIAIDPVGNILPCLNFRLVLGNIHDSSIKDIWENSEQLKRLKEIRWRDLKHCMKCDKNQYCLRCAGRAITNSDLLGISKADCKMSAIRYKIRSKEERKNEL